MPKIPEFIVGHQAVQGQLLSDVATRNVSHAYLFSGAAHLGKTSTALWFSHLLLSDHVPAEGRAKVRSEMERFIHPDFLCLDDLWVEDVRDDWAVIAKSSNVPQHHRSKAPAAKTDAISIEDVRALSERLVDTGTGPRVVCIIRGIERMQVAAANAFLKILEEPPSRVTFILTTDNHRLVPETVISRARIVRFSPVSRQDIEQLIDGADEEDADFAWHIAQGAPGMMQILLRDPDLLRTHRQLHAQARSFWKTSSLKDRFAWLLEAAGKKGDTPRTLLHLGLALRELPASENKAKGAGAYAALLRGLQTNAHRDLLLERFALAVQ